MTLKSVFHSTSKFWLPVFWQESLSLEPCDVLLLHPWEGNKARTRNLVAAITKYGLKVCDHVMVRSLPEIMKLRPFKSPYSSAESFDPVYDAYAAYLSEKHKPKIIVTFFDSAEFSHSIRRQFNSVGAKVVNLSHGITGTNQSYEVFDFDYYFVYGESSVEACFQNKVRRGNTRLVEAGSFFIPSDFKLDSNPDSNRIVYLSDGTDDPSWERVLEILKLLGDCSKLDTAYDFFIKHHPMENTQKLKSALPAGSKIKFYPQNISLKEALEPASIALTGWSNSAVEAAILDRPVLRIDPRRSKDTYLEVDRFFGPSASTPEEIKFRLDEIKRNFDLYLSRKSDFVSRHLKFVYDGTQVTAEYLWLIANNKEVPYQDISGTAPAKLRF